MINLGQIIEMKQTGIITQYLIILLLKTNSNTLHKPLHEQALFVIPSKISKHFVL